MKNLFSPIFHKEIKLNVKKSYNDFLDEIEDSIDEISGSFSKDFESFLLESLRKKPSFSPLAFYWASQLNRFFTILLLHEDYESNDDDEEIFHFWDESEYAGIFLESLNKFDQNIQKASSSLIPHLEESLMSFYYFHLSDSSPKKPLSYTLFPEIGDFSGRIYKTDHHLFCNGAFSEKNSLKDIGQLKFEKLSSFYKKGEYELFLCPHQEKDIVKRDQFESDIREALDVIEHVSEDLKNTFLSFTHTIVPIDTEGIVSYSMQSLPGYSSINLYERDFIDLLDDLLHENGHHFLNTFLNFTDLINEDDEKIYYSPWRKSLRPIRGIYHATFTFFWAYRLFLEISRKASSLQTTFPSRFDDLSIIKSKSRAIEELLMLQYCLEDLRSAHKEGKITSRGNNLIKEVKALIDKDSNFVLSLENDIKEESVGVYKEIQKLKAELIEKRSLYGIR